jgi:CheY-like chemotaxis protein
VSRLRQGWPDIPVLMMTGYAHDSSDPLLGNDSYLAKPFTAASLAAATARAIERGKSRLDRRDPTTHGRSIPS